MPLSREPSREPIREPSRELRREPSRDLSREPRREPSREPSRELRREPSREPRENRVEKSVVLHLRDVYKYILVHTKIPKVRLVIIPKAIGINPKIQKYSQISQKSYIFFNKVANQNQKSTKISTNF